MPRTPIDPKLIHDIGGLLTTLVAEIKAFDDVERPNPKLWALMEHVLQQAAAEGKYIPRAEKPEPTAEDAMDPGIRAAFRMMEEFDDVERPDPQLLAALVAITGDPEVSGRVERPASGDFSVLGCVHRFLTPFSRAGGTPSLLQWFAENSDSMGRLVAAMKAIKDFDLGTLHFVRFGQRSPRQRLEDLLGEKGLSTASIRAMVNGVPNFESFDLPVNSQQGSGNAEKGGPTKPREVVRGRNGQMRKVKSKNRR